MIIRYCINVRRDQNVPQEGDNTHNQMEGYHDERYGLGVPADEEGWTPMEPSLDSKILVFRNSSFPPNCMLLYISMFVNSFFVRINRVQSCLILSITF